MDKADKYNQMIARYDKLEHIISQLKATNGGINLSQDICTRIENIKKEQQLLINEAAFMQNNY